MIFAKGGRMAGQFDLIQFGFLQRILGQYTPGSWCRLLMFASKMYMSSRGSASVTSSFIALHIFFYSGVSIFLLCILAGLGIFQHWRCTRFSTKGVSDKTVSNSFFYLSHSSPYLYFDICTISAFPRFMTNVYFPKIVGLAEWHLAFAWHLPRPRYKGHEVEPKKGVELSLDQHDCYRN